MPRMLPIVQDEDEECFFDERLRQLRSVRNPHKFRDLDDFEMEYFGNQAKNTKQVVNMGILREKIQKAFSMYKSGDFKGFVRELVDAGDVRYQFHRDIVDAEVEEQLGKL
jgi:hypothetical protein